jgi:predicted dehydrogenase
MPACHRRDFLAASSAAAGAFALPAATYGRILGSNERIGIAFLGTGLRCNDHITVVNRLKVEKKNVDLVGACDVWDGNDEIRRGLYYSAKRCGLDPADTKHVTKDYRRLLELPEVDVVCIATPDHWHAKMSIDAAAAGKDVFCEKPMTRTIDEAHAVVDAMKKYQRVMTVGVQSMADPTWMRAYELIKAGKIGHVAQTQTSYYRNSIAGQWRTYKLTKDMTPQTIDWDLFLGHQFSVLPGVPLAPKMPFDRAVYGQWRCYWPFGGGMFTDLFVHQTTHLIAAMGVRYPARVMGGGGIYLEYDGRDVPDVATVVADYEEGCQLIITATMINRYPIEEVIRGRLGTIKFVKDGFEIIADNPGGGPGAPPRLEDRIRGEFVDCKPPKGPHADTYALWENFLECCRSRQRETWSTPELGAAAFTTVMLGVHSYREGHVLMWDKEQRRAVPGNGSWAAGWEKRSQERGKPNNIHGWAAGDAGCVLEPPAYMKLAGPWVDGKDPAGA